MYTHACIKCRNQYQDTDPEAYYCAPCNEQRKQIAAQIDAKIRPSKNYKSEIQEYNEAPKVRGFLHVRL